MNASLRPKKKQAQRKSAKRRTKRPSSAPDQTELYGFETFTAKELKDREFPDLRYAIDGYIAEGLTILGGKPKMGKSYMALSLALAVSSGRKAFGSIECAKGPVLYLALEDNERRIQRRVRQLQPNDDEWPADLYVTTVAKRLDEGLVDGLEAWIREHEPALVIIDTLAKVRATSSRDGYDADYAALTPLQELAGVLGVAIVIIHHLRKMGSDDPFDMISGTTGLTGAVDAALILQRGQQGITLYGRGREIEEIEHALEFESGEWHVLGDADEVRRSKERKAILQVLADLDKGMGPTEVADALGWKVDNVKQLLFKMHNDGDVKKTGHGRYINAGKK